MSAGVYLHIPFCKTRCHYCDFATDVYRSNEIVDSYVNALTKEIELFPTKEFVDTIYFGGGTPSLLKPAQLEKILKAVSEKFDISPGAEVTMEMNPATMTAATVSEFRSLGVNRASFGAQTFDDTELKRIGRAHNAQDVRETIDLLRNAGFENVSFDLIAGLPRQTIEDWERNLDEAVKLAPEHLSLYLLEIHEGTPLADQVRTGRQPKPDEDLAGEMYSLMVERVTAAGYRQYEISNFSKPGFESRHNTKYWLCEPVYGFGVSAHSFDGKQRYSNERDTVRYVGLIESSGTAGVIREDIEPASEYVFLGLRLNDGVDLEEYRKRFEIDLLQKFPDVQLVIEAELVEINNGRLRLTTKGFVMSNEVFQIFV
jgi:oxygen-independent coproporphyrinogen-3 oxidase